MDYTLACEKSNRERHELKLFGDKLTLCRKKGSFVPLNGAAGT